MLRRNACWLLVFVLAGCAVGPDYEVPDVAVPETFRNSADVARGDGVMPQDLFTSMGDETLNALINEALAKNLDIRQAAATLAETRALSNLEVYSLVPTVGVSGAFERSEQSPQDPFGFPGQGVVERYRAGFDASWEIDLFGSLRGQSRQIRAQVESDAASLEAARVAVVAEVAQAYFSWRGESRRLALLTRNLELLGERVALLEATLEAGRGTALDVARARSTERSLASSLPTARASVERALQRLSVLTRTPADALAEQLGESTALPPLPRFVAVGEPIDWLSRRPDVVAAERLLADATSAVGVQVAEYFPKLNLLGDFGWTGRESSALGDSAAERWQVAPTLSWRILDFGRIRQRVRVSEAQLDGALVSFERTWVVALEETENALAGYRATTERAVALEEAVDAAADAARLARLRYDAGADSYLSVLDADRTRIDLEDQLAAGRTDRATALAALYKALGGTFAIAE